MQNAILFCALILCASLHAQDYFKLATVGYQLYPNSAYQGANSESTEGVGAQSTNQISTFDFTLPLVRKDSSTILLGAFTEYLSLDLVPGADPETFLSVTAKVGYNFYFNKKWSLAVMALPKLSSDISAIGARSYQMGGAALVKWAPLKRWNHRLGFYVNSDLFGPYVTPLLGMYHQSPSGRHTFNILLPRMGEYTYRVNPRLRAGARIEGGIRSHYLENAQLSSDPQYIQRTDSEAKLLVQAHLGKSFVAELSAGKTVGRKYRVYDADDRIDLGMAIYAYGDNRTPINNLIGEGMVYGAKLIYKVDL